MLVLHFSPENRSEGAAIAWTHKFSPSPRPRIRILNECRMFGNKRGESERESVERHQREKMPRFFFSRLGRRAFLKLALVWLSVKVEGKTPVE